MVLVNLWRYPDPYQRFLIRIRIRPNDTDPTGSGSETLVLRFDFVMIEIEMRLDDILLDSRFRLDKDWIFIG